MKMSHQLLILVLSTLAISFTSGATLKDEVVYERLVEKIVQKFRLQGELFEHLARTERVYARSQEEKFTVVADDISMKGINFTLITGIKDAKQVGTHSHTMQLTFNLGNPILTTDITVIPANQVQEPMNLKTTALSYGNDLEITATVTVNTQWKNVIPTAIQFSKVPTFASYSDCQNATFCENFHTWVDGSIWNPIYNSLNYVMKQALFKIVLDHEL